ncbi:hypothetical protein B0I27_101328 [Arcticibacter pallidicorallinus]|uniref:Uncharacterized protein n=1 Tax=Arcticibacter pallidicorallinus TaxID=1259464 RepID=A0A2T0UBR6_9SPHI|nr:hypothetical protein [Arcticibacter pallidicorallinus]PRY55359.1 hypothetical protein B0I27_101328 [Arcticibacter pallidicorallinus]
MVTISDIRIGNILHPDRNDHTIVATVRAIEENKIGFYEHASVAPAEVAAVSLTPLWLAGYSFSYSQEQLTWSKGKMILNKVAEGFVFSLGDHRQALRHVHQLQNLYFALFTENLEVELDQEAAYEEVELAADSVMVNYLPKDKQCASFSFNLAAEGKIYQVFYKKDPQGYWNFSSYSEIN